MLASWQGDRPLINHAVMVLVVVPPKIVIFHRQAVYRRGRNMLSCLMVGPRTLRRKLAAAQTPHNNPGIRCPAESSNPMYSSGIMDTQDSEAGRNPLWESQSMMEPQGGAANPLYGSQSDIMASRDSMGAGGHFFIV